jgi:hypothetical protein
MIRTQVYLEDQIHKDLMRLAQQENTSMAEVTRAILKEGIAKRQTVDTTGKKTLQKLFAIKATGGDDPYLSENIDHYLYGAPKKRP